MFTRKIPQIQDTVVSMNVRKAYIPVWYYDMAISADIIPFSSEESSEALLKAMGPPRQVLGIGFNCYWPGHTWNPVSYLAFTKPNKDKVFVPFTKDLYENMGDVEVIPFTVDPLRDLGYRAPSVLEGLTVDVPSQRSFKINNANVLLQAAYPVYLPVYVAQFTGNEDEDPKTVVVSADNEDPCFYQWEATKTGAYQWINSGPWINLDVTERVWRMGFRNPLEQLVKKFLDQAVGHFQTTNEINWEDERIQNIATYEEPNKRYLEQLFKVWSRRNMLALTENLDGDKKAIGFGNKEHPGIKVMKVDEIREDIMKKIGDELNELEKLEPTWYKNFKNKI